MFSLTFYERKVLVSIGLLILLGSVLRFLKVNSQINRSLTTSNISESIENVSSTRNQLTQIPININKASQEELVKLPGIGEKIAAQLIEYRYRYGDFRTLDDLKKVKGIGAKKAEKIKEYIEF